MRVFDIFERQDVDEDWKKVNRRDKTDGMSRKAVNAYRRENPGSKLQTAVTTKPSKLKKGSKSAKRRKSFCARMKGMKKAHAGAKTKRNPDSPINKALRRWNCESIEEMRDLIVYAEQIIAEEKQRLDPKCWKGYKKQGTKMKGGVRVNNCVPVEEEDANEAVNLDRSRVPGYPNDPATLKHRKETAQRILWDPKSDPDSRREAAAILARMEKQGEA